MALPLCHNGSPIFRAANPCGEQLWQIWPTKPHPAQNARYLAGTQNSGEIIVTATRKSKSINKVSLSVSAPDVTSEHAEGGDRAPQGWPEAETVLSAAIS